MSARQRSYIVFGTTGEYADRDEWPIVTYSDSLAADRHADEASKWAAENGHAPPKRTNRYLGTVYPLNPWDPHMRVDFNGVTYFIRSVPARIDSVRPVDG